MNREPKHNRSPISAPLITTAGISENRKHLKRALFLDRDGVIVEDKGHISLPNALVILPGVAEALSEVQRDFRLIVVTNQSGIARGYFTETDLHDIHQRLVRLLIDRGVILDAIYYCPHHPTEGIEHYRTNCNCRKPKPGLFLAAAEQFGIELRQSITIGDKSRDIEAGKTAGTRTILVRSVSQDVNAGSISDRIVTHFGQIIPMIRDLS